MTIEDRRTTKGAVLACLMLRSDPNETLDQYIKQCLHHIFFVAGDEKARRFVLQVEDVEMDEEIPNTPALRKALSLHRSAQIVGTDSWLLSYNS